MPHARTRMRTSSGPISGTGMSVSSSFLYSVRRRAFMLAFHHTQRVTLKTYGPERPRQKKLGGGARPGGFGRGRTFRTRGTLRQPRTESAGVSASSAGGGSGQAEPVAGAGQVPVNSRFEPR